MKVIYFTVQNTNFLINIILIKINVLPGHTQVKLLLVALIILLLLISIPSY